MTSNDYHIVSEWRFEGQAQEVYDILSQPEELTRWWPSVYLSIEQIKEADENNLGQGFPRKLRGLRLHPLGKIVALANAFVDLTLPSPSNPHPKDTKAAIDFLEKTLGKPYDKQAFKALKEIAEKDKSSAA